MIWTGWWCRCRRSRFRVRVAPRSLSRLRGGLARGAGPVWRGVRGGVGLRGVPLGKRLAGVFGPRKRPYAVALGLIAGLVGSPVSACQGFGQGQVPKVEPIETSLTAPFEMGSGAEAVAYFGDPTFAYGHRIMGRVPEAQSLVVVFSGPCGPNTVVADVRAGEGHVFEDIAPRIVDLDGDDIPEVIAVRSSFSQGAQLAVYGLRGEMLDVDLRLIGVTPYIGTRYRWLAPAAWEDLDGDGHVELAYVDRPHLAKVLRVWRWRDGALHKVAALEGVTNHAIGEEVINGFTRLCGDLPEMVLQSADRRRLVGVTLVNETLAARDLGPARQMEARRRC